MRFEYKYKIKNTEVPALRSMLMPFVKLDRFAEDSPEHAYTVRSIYFDTPTFEMYHTKMDHLAHRMKVRLRGYNVGTDESTVFLEIKRKYEGPIRKNRCSIAYGTVKKMFAGAHFDDLFPETVQVDDARRFFYQIYKRNLRPVVNVIYEREPYYSAIPDKENDCRITLDMNWRGAPYPGVDELFVERDTAWALKEYSLLEVKFNHYCPHWIKPILAELDLYKEPASKYVACVDAHPSIDPFHNRINLMTVPYLRHQPQPQVDPVQLPAHV